MTSINQDEAHTLPDRTPFFLSLVRSFHSLAFYDEVRRHWSGKGFLYLFLLVILTTVLNAIGFQRYVSDFVDNELPVLVKDMPDIKISGGEASIEAKQPFFIESGDSLIAVLDTTGTVVSLENSDALILMTRSNIQVRGMGGGVSEVPLSDLGDMEVTRDKLVEGSRALTSVIAVIIFPFMAGLAYLYRVLQLLAFALIVRLWTARAAPILSFETLLRLTAVALTPAVILEAVVFLLNLGFPLMGLFYQLVAAAYVFQAARTAVARSTEEAMVSDGST